MAGDTSVETTTERGAGTLAPPDSWRARGSVTPEMVQRLRSGTDLLTAAALRRLDEELPWYRALAAEDRSWIGLVAQSGIAAFISWAQAKMWSKHPEEFGHGSIEGITASEAGNNSVVGGDLVPMLTLGVPGDPEDNPTLAWPESREQEKVGTLTIFSAMPQKNAACEKVNFDPLVMGDGIAPTSDPILLFRSPAYAVSFAKRLSGL